jgi:hypothetical protein
MSALPDFLRSNGSESGSTQPLEYNTAEELLERKSSGSGYKTENTELGNPPR